MRIWIDSLGQVEELTSGVRVEVTGVWMVKLVALEGVGYACICTYDIFLGFVII